MRWGIGLRLRARGWRLRILMRRLTRARGWWAFLVVGVGEEGAALESWDGVWGGCQFDESALKWLEHLASSVEKPVM